MARTSDTRPETSSAAPGCTGAIPGGSGPPPSGPSKGRGRRGSATRSGSIWPARAYLLGCWDERDLARLFLSGDNPPGFDAIARSGLRRWIDQNMGVLQLEGRRFGEALAAAVTGVVAAGARQIVECATREEVHDAYNEMIDAANRQRAWGVSTVNSWYKNALGRVAQNWPFTLMEYWERTCAPDLGDYHIL
jgi:hypothetical protein